MLNPLFSPPQIFSEVRIYDPSGDSTIPSTSKKRKFEEVADDDGEPETPAAKSKKPKKEPVREGVWNRSKPDVECV